MFFRRLEILLLSKISTGVLACLSIFNRLRDMRYDHPREVNKDARTERRTLACEDLIRRIWEYLKYEREGINRIQACREAYLVNTRSKNLREARRTSMVGSGHLSIILQLLRGWSSSWTCSWRTGKKWHWKSSRGEAERWVDECVDRFWCLFRVTYEKRTKNEVSAHRIVDY